MPLNKRRDLEKWNKQVEGTKLRQRMLKARRKRQEVNLKEKQFSMALRKSRKTIRDRLKWLKSIERQVIEAHRAA